MKKVLNFKKLYFRFFGMYRRGLSLAAEFCVTSASNTAELASLYFLAAEFCVTSASNTAELASLYFLS